MTNRPRGHPTEPPKWVEPQLSKLVDAPPQGPEWLHEIKYDGYRVHARLDRGRAWLLTRTGLDWTYKYPAMATALSLLPAKQAYHDGELCGIRPDGKTSFSLIQTASGSGNSDALVFFLFDLLYFDGEVISAAPLLDRTKRLRHLLSNAGTPLEYSDHQIGRGPESMRGRVKVKWVGAAATAGRAPHDQFRFRHARRRPAARLDRNRQAVVLQAKDAPLRISPTDHYELFSVLALAAIAGRIGCIRTLRDYRFQRQFTGDCQVGRFVTARSRREHARNRIAQTPAILSRQRQAPRVPSEGPRSPPLSRNNQGKKLGDGVGRNFVATGTLVLNRLSKVFRSGKAVVVPSLVSDSPSRVVGPLSSVIPKMPTFVAWSDTTTPFLPIKVEFKLPSINLIGISSQQMNSVVVDNWFSLPI